MTITHTDTGKSQLIINEMSKSIYDNITPNEDELYLVTDEEIVPNATSNSKGIVQPDNTTITVSNGVISGETIKNKVTNCILTAPNGVFELNTTTGYYEAKAGITFLSAKGIKTDGSIDNFYGTLSSAISFNTIPSTSSGWHMIYFFSGDNGQTWAEAIRSLPNQWFEQDTQPTPIDGNGTWFDTKNKKWYILTTENPTWTQILVVKLAVAYLTSGVITAVKDIQEPIEVKTSDSNNRSSVRLDTTHVVSIPYNTVFQAPSKGIVVVWTELSTTNGGSINIIGFKGDTVDTTGTGTIVYTAYKTTDAYTSYNLDLVSTQIPMDYSEKIYFVSTINSGNTSITLNAYFYPYESEVL